MPLRTKFQNDNILTLKKKKAIYDKLICVATCECPGMTLLEAPMKLGGTWDWFPSPTLPTEPATPLMHSDAGGSSWDSTATSCISIREKI